MAADGLWNTTMKTPMGPQVGTLELTTNGDSLSGSMKSAQGDMEFSGGTVDGDRLAWTLEITSPMPMKLEFAATVDGDSLAGEVKLGAFGTAQLEGVRA
jgi:hypothetical protein